MNEITNIFFLIAVLLGPGDIEFDVRMLNQYPTKQACMDEVETNGHSYVRGIANQYHFEQSIADNDSKFSVPLEKIFLVCSPISIDNL